MTTTELKTMLAKQEIQSVSVDVYNDELLLLFKNGVSVQIGVVPYYESAKFILESSVEKEAEELLQQKRKEEYNNRLASAKIKKAELLKTMTLAQLTEIVTTFGGKI